MSGTACSTHCPLPQSTPDPSQRTVDASTICAKLLTTVEGRKEVLLLSIDKPLTIGRNPVACSYVVQDTTVSAIHCKIYAIRSSQGGIMVSCQDLSSNGLLLNGMRIRKTCVLIRDGDFLQIGSRKFRCKHTVKNEDQRLHFFDPTPQPDSPSRTKVIGQYILTNHCLGSGSFATVHLGLDTTYRSSKQVACKIIKKKKDANMDKMMKEVRILKGLNHPGINRVFDVHNDETFLYIFLQLCTGGDLFSYIVHHREPESRLNEGETKYIMYQLLLGLKYLHEKHISHRDVKPENVLLYSPGRYPRIQLADFGLARRKSYQETFNVCGTVSYLPPEGILALENKDMTYIGMPADCWSAGLMLYIMLAGHHPFDYGDPAAEAGDAEEATVEDLKSWEEKLSLDYIRNDRKVRRRIVDDAVELSAGIWEHLNDAQTLCLGLLAFYAEERWTIQDAIHSQWIQSDIDELAEAYAQRVSADGV
ncbi:kinase-like protein [Irpex rosettiformis]|uniref:Kinase-like protein n=1 Tax=Irpex rosettiformis TaxID=378272 RepID=A0ACB8ULB3_9APHY|nr:kinase-like protein [Irpex rosettiformis]